MSAVLLIGEHPRQDEVRRGMLRVWLTNIAKTCQKGYVPRHTPRHTPEGLIIIGFAALFALTAGVAANYELVNLVAGQTIMFKYKFVIWPAITAIPALCVIGLSVSKLAIKQNKAL